MCRTGYHVAGMSKMIQIRDVPDDLHRELKKRAEEKSLSLSDYLKFELKRMAERPTWEELGERIRQREPVHFSEPIEDIIRGDRDTH
jgi:antitoxin FitA